MRPKLPRKLKTITGRQLAEWRVFKMELTQEELSYLLDCTRRIVTRYEQADITVPRRFYLACQGLEREMKRR